MKTNINYFTGLFWHSNNELTVDCFVKMSSAWQLINVMLAPINLDAKNFFLAFFMSKRIKVKIIPKAGRQYSYYFFHFFVELNSFSSGCFNFFFETMSHELVAMKRKQLLKFQKPAQQTPYPFYLLNSFFTGWINFFLDYESWTFYFYCKETDHEGKIIEIPYKLSSFP